MYLAAVQREALAHNKAVPAVAESVQRAA
jgi:hypothetical protein